jgi:hypothetical protein
MYAGWDIDDDLAREPAGGVMVDLRALASAGWAVGIPTTRGNQPWRPSLGNLEGTDADVFAIENVLQLLKSPQFDLYLAGVRRRHFQIDPETYVTSGRALGHSSRRLRHPGTTPSSAPWDGLAHRSTRSPADSIGRYMAVPPCGAYPLSAGCRRGWSRLISGRRGRRRRSDLAVLIRGMATCGTGAVPLRSTTSRMAPRPRHLGKNDSANTR